MTDGCIPEAWIQKYVDQLLAAALMFSPGPMRDSALRRAEAVMEMVKSYRERSR